MNLCANCGVSPRIEGGVICHECNRPLGFASELRVIGALAAQENMTPDERLKYIRQEAQACLGVK